MKVMRLLTVGLVVLWCGITLGGTNEVELVYLDSRDYGIERNMTAMEMERRPAVSRIKIIGGASGDTLFDIRTFCQIAKARGCNYYVVLSAEECGDFSWTYYVGFTDNQTPDIKKEFGSEFSDRDESGKKRPVVRVANYDVKFGGTQDPGAKAQGK